MLGGLDYKGIGTRVKAWLSALANVPSVKGDLWTSDGSINQKQAVGTDGYTLVSNSGSPYGLLYSPPALGYNLVGGYLSWSVATNILTLAVKTWSGNDPSAAEPVFYAVRDVTAATGSLTYRKLTTPLSLSIPNTALMGTVNGIAFRLWGAVFNDGGTDRIALINCLSTVAGAGAGRDVTAIFPLAGWGIASATLADTAADNSQVLYANAAIASKAYTVLGWASWETGLAAAGTWSAGPTRMQLWGPGSLLPGQVVQVQRNSTGAVATGVTALPNDDTIPQSNEGDQYMSQAITPSSAANVLVNQAQLSLAHSANTTIIAALFQDATANALAAEREDAPAVNNIILVSIVNSILASTTAATTFKARAGTATGATTTFNGSAGSRFLGGVISSYIQSIEIMG